MDGAEPGDRCPPAGDSGPPGPACSYNEWDLLEEAIVGIVDDASFPTWHLVLKPVLPAGQQENFRRHSGQESPAEQVSAARRELDEFCRILHREGVKARRPEPMPQRLRYNTLHWASTGMYAAMSWEALLVIGTEIIECPMAWRSHYYESLAYRLLLKEHFKNGARWSAAPSELRDELFDHEGAVSSPSSSPRLVVKEFEPTFDAADFVRCGHDIFTQKSHVTNEFGIEWLQRHLGGGYRIHVLEFNDSQPMHIDATLMPLAPGKLLIHPERVPKVPSMFKGRDVLKAPIPVLPDSHPQYFTSKWLNMNILMLNQKRVVVERQDEPMIAALRKFGFSCVLCDFRTFFTFGGFFHCATLDVQRRDMLESYSEGCTCR
ncbi:hypothetical protein ACIHFD_35995 [Nonomuraea sp. NPDC051941]|uniref:hypothetical protein n=1 Tax=Nonomuraea sp. NPDC051941 TaxID=3364373 RepID=UPI0037C84944